MRIYDGKNYREMTLEEQLRVAMLDEYERTRPLTAEEVTAMLTRQQINILNVDDNTALRMLTFYPGSAAYAE